MIWKFPTDKRPPPQYHITMPGIIASLPPLPTYLCAPSWLNKGGRVDRSACLELRASDLWRHAIFSPAPRTSIEAHTPQTPHLEAIARVKISARWLSKLHHARNPLKLKGDWRTSKSNAMKNVLTSRDRKGAIDQSMHETPDAHQFISDRDAQSRRAAFERFDGEFLKLHPIPANNPNKGAGMTKMLGLWEDWTQEVTIEKWWMHDRLTQHFLKCPTQDGLPPLPPPERGEGRGEGSSPKSLCLKPDACQCKSLLLFMPLCTPPEVLDAELAEGWIKMTESRYAALGKPLPPSVIEKRRKLLERYGVLFRGRKLVCRKCLGLRYGEVKSKRIHTDVLNSDRIHHP